MFARLLVGLDGSSGADAALDAAIGLARRFKTTIVLAAITDIRLLEGPLLDAAGALWTEGAPAAPVTLELRAALEERVQRVLDVAVARVAEAGLASESVRATGLVDEELLRFADRAEALVVGRRGELHAAPGTLGAVTVHVIKKSPKPVLVAGDRPSTCQRPVVAYDGGETSSHALELAARYAEALELPLAVVHVSGDAPAGDALLAKATAYLSSRRVAFEAHRLEGAVAPTIAAFTARYAGDLLVAGAHGGRRRSWAVGSHAERLLRVTTIPVLIHR
jgi:nucleotide-binding universal stress UspA family protein